MRAARVSIIVATFALLLFAFAGACIPDVTAKVDDAGTSSSSSSSSSGSASSSSSSSGSTTIDSGAPAKCGNGVPEQGEDCDDGNTDDTDGCSSQCKLAGGTATATSACPGLDVHVWATTQPTLTSSTTGSGNRTSDVCATNGSIAANGSESADRIFKVTAHVSGTLTVATSNVDFNVYLYSSATCTDPNVTLANCVNQTDGVGAETLKFAVTQGTTYTIYVDGASLSGEDDTSEGDFTVTFSIQ